MTEKDSITTGLEAGWEDDGFLNPDTVIPDRLRYRVTKVLEAVVSAKTEGDAINLFIAGLANGDDLGPKVTYPLYRVSPVDIEVL